MMKSGIMIARIIAERVCLQKIHSKEIQNSYLDLFQKIGIRDIKEKVVNYILTFCPALLYTVFHYAFYIPYLKTDHSIELGLRMLFIQ